MSKNSSGWLGDVGLSLAFRLALVLALFGGLIELIRAQQPLAPLPIDSSQAGYVPGVEPLRVLLIGDSMTVGGFGQGMQEYLEKRFGRRKIAVYGSCGSSPEHWLRSEPDFITKCGYREYTPLTEIIYDFENGRHPQPALTPKVDDLIQIFRPRTVIIQLGTNWMDAMPGRAAAAQGPYNGIIDQIIDVVRGPGSRQIIWVTPPDSAHYSAEVQHTVLDLIKAAAKKHSFEVIDSSLLTHYAAGRSGGDGIHYNTKDAMDWAGLAARQLEKLMR
jgi:hypothetical protein